MVPPEFRYPGDLTEHVERAWNSYPFEERLNRRPKPLSPRLVEGILHAAYHATFTREEGRPTQFSLMLIDASDYFERLNDVAMIYPLYSFIKFERALPLSSSEVRRLAPALNPRTSALTCRRIGRSFKLEISGAVDWGSSLHRMNYGPGHRGTFPPEFFVASGLAPGNLTLAIGDDSFLSLRDGAVRELVASEDVLTSELFADALVALRRAVTSELSRPHSEPSYLEQVYLGAYRRILLNVREQRHGGTLIVVPDATSKSRLSSIATMKYAPNRLEEAAVPQSAFRRYRQIGDDYGAALLTRQVWASKRTWPALIDHLVDWQRYHCSWERLHQVGESEVRRHYRESETHRDRAEHSDERLDDSLAFIARLAAVDGAVVISDRFQLKGFGGEVRAAAPKLADVQFGNVSAGTVTRSLEEFGTRHRSAFRFCYALPSAIAFTVSQDGDVRMARRVANDVVVVDVGL